jgi:hypothetical protein
LMSAHLVARHELVDARTGNGVPRDVGGRLGSGCLPRKRLHVDARTGNGVPGDVGGRLGSGCLPRKRLHATRPAKTPY